jgi:hypothetical protein
MRARPDVCGLFSTNVVSFSSNVVPSGSLFSINLVPKQRMFLGQAIYVLSPLHIGNLLVLRARAAYWFVAGSTVILVGAPLSLIEPVSCPVVASNS